MIRAAGLGRSWGGRRVVQDVGFEVAAGEVVGLLGPNGAGKTTTLRMLAGSLAASAGRASVGGFDVLDDPLEVKRRVGFLPERPPVHPEMEVAAYLGYAAALRGVADAVAAVRDAVAKAGLVGWEGRRIGNLSKGYRQRVGVAAAIVHRPPALLLDEPTSGLDPAERVELRRVIRALAAEGAAVILSTHILAEVESTCDRVLVLSAGRLVADQALAALAGASRLRLRVARSGEVAAALAGVPGVVALTEEADGAWLITVDGDAAPAIGRAVAGLDLLELSRPRGLEEAYLALTGGAA
jgi:ABC-2 type transport system ATP-binding protein